MKVETQVRVAISTGIVVVFVALTSWRTFYGDTLASSFLSVALLSLLVILVRTRFAFAEVGAVVVLAGVFAILDVNLLHYPVRWQVWLSFVGLASLAVLALRVVWSEGEARRTAWFTVVPAFLFVASEWCADYFLVWTEHAHPKVLDLYLYSFDASLHVQIPFLVGQAFASSFLFAIISIFFYLGLPLVIGLTFAGCVVTDRRKAVSAFLAFFLAGPLGACFYNLFPALGPIHIMRQGFPWHPLSIEQASHLFLEPIAAAGPRNAMPSLHATWVFLALWYARKLSTAERIVASLFVIFTLFATVGTGEHYFVDLVVALPFSLMIISVAGFLTSGDTRLVIPVIVGLGATVVWLAALRFGLHVFWISPVVPWAACAATVLLSFYGLRFIREPAASAEAQPAMIEQEHALSGANQ